MPHGIEVYNADGSLQFDIGNRLMMTLADVDMGTANGSVTVPDLSLGGALIVVNASTVPPNVSVSGNVVSWDYGTTPTYMRGGTLNVMVY